MTAPLSVTTASDQLLCRIAGIGDLFAIEGEFVTGKEIPSGHINTTYKATYRKSDGTEDSYILQRINDYVFTFRPPNPQPLPGPGRTQLH